MTELGAAYHDELRVGRQLRLHAENVPYRSLAATLLALADREDGHAALLREEMTRLGGSEYAAGSGVPRGGRNYWQRLTFDLEDLRAKMRRYLESARHWDVEFPETAALFQRIAHEDAASCRVIGELVTRSDPHAAD
jgi:hypothetical protein